MAGFSLITTLTLQAAGFSKGIDKAKKESKALATGVKEAGDSIKGAFGNLGNIFSPMLGDLQGLQEGVLGGVSAFKSMIPALNGVRAAFIASGIGAIVLVVVAAIAALVSWMKRTDEGSDTMRKVFDQIKAVINVVLDRLAKLGGAIVKLIKGDFKGAWEDAKGAVTGFGDAVQENLKKAEKLNEAQDELENKQEVYAKKRAELEVTISELKNQARDVENNSAQERLDANNKLRQKIKELYDLDYSLKSKSLEVLKTEISMSTDNQDNRQKVNEAEAELVKLRAEYNNNLKETLELNKTLITASKEEQTIQASRAQGGMTKIASKSAGVVMNRVENTNGTSSYSNTAPTLSSADMAAGINKAAEAQKKLNEEAENLKNDNIINFGTAWQQMGANLNGYTNVITENFQKINLAAGMASDAISALANIFEASKQKEIQAAGNDAAKKEAIEKKYRNRMKAMAIASAVINGAQAVLQALGNYPPPLSFIMAALQGGVAATQIAVIAGQKFAQGGIVGGYSFSGDKVPALVNSGEMILNGKQQSNLFKLINSGAGAGNSELTTRVSGSDLVFVLANHNKRLSRIG